MGKFTEKKHFIGVDISKDQLDLALLHVSQPDKFTNFVTGNDFNGFDSIIEWMKKQKVNLEDCLFCMEHTGTYGLLLFAWLSQVGIDYCVEPGLKIKKSLGVIRGKNDPVDARRIADYACTHKAKLEPFTLPSGLVLQIKQLLTYRDQLVRINTSLKNSLQSHKEYQRVSGLRSISEDIECQISDNEMRQKRIETQIIELIRSDESLYKNYKLAISVKGIAFVIATYMLVTTNNFTSFENSRKYACYSGIAPFDHTSGTTIKVKSRVSNLANKKIKTLLSNGANSACIWDPELRNYYKRKIAEGKDHKLVINSISYKLVNRVFAVIKRQTPYVNLYQQNFA
jgi:transposase